MTQTIDNFFAELYCKEEKIDFKDCRAEYTQNGLGYNSIMIRGHKGDNSSFCKEVDLMEAFNLMSKYILKQKRDI